MGQIKKLVPKARRDRIVATAERFLPEGSRRRQHFANAISVGGVALVLAGGELDRRDYKVPGVFSRMLGHATDDVDGDTARRLGTAGRPGAIVDGMGDKVKVAEELRTLWRHTQDMPPDAALKRRTMLGVIAAKHAVTAALVAGIEHTGTKAQSSLAGKANMWADGLTFAAMNVADLSPNATVQTVSNRAADGLFAAGMVTGVAASVGYARELIEARRLADSQLAAM